MTAMIVPAGRDWNNYHTHTYRCNHASSDVDDYVARAVEAGMTKLGMSEHAYVKNGGKQPFRMSGPDVEGYVRACREADEKCEAVKVFCGVECDYDPSDESFFREYYLEEQKLDYLIGSVHELKGGEEIMDCFADRHFGVRELRIYTDLYIKMMESGLFTFCAHPDLFGRPIEIGADPSGWDENAVSVSRQILDAAAETGTVLEINVSGVRKTKSRNYPAVIYPRWQFWEMAADYDIPVIVNTDAHGADQLDANVEYGLDLVRKYGLRRMELAQESKSPASMKM